MFFIYILHIKHEANVCFYVCCLVFIHLFCSFCLVGWLYDCSNEMQLVYILFILKNCCGFV